MGTHGYPRCSSLHSSPVGFRCDSGPGHGPGPARVPVALAHARHTIPVRHPIPPAAFVISSIGTVRHSIPSAS